MTWIAGVDEAGRGPCLGPLVVAAFALPQTDLELLVENGVNDSKQLDPAERQRVADWLRNEGAERGWRMQVHSSSARDVDLAMQVSNLTSHEIDIFALLLDAVIGGAGDLGGGVLALDACHTNAHRFGELVASRLDSWPWAGWVMDSRHRHDETNPAVSAASVLAKVERDEQVRTLEAELEIPIGSGYPSDTRTREALSALVAGDEPWEHLRWGWATTAAAWEVSHGSAVPLRPRDGQFRPGQQRLSL